jgi:hypothetical protein
MDQIISYTLTFLTGGALWEGVKFIFPEIQRYLQGRREASDSLYKNIDPILKAASELYGKLESLAKEDFATFANPQNSNSIDPKHNRKYIYYLFAQFWGQLENLRLQSQYTRLSRLKKGKELLRFIETFESRKFRLLDRSIQRIIGECVIVSKNQKFSVLTLSEFIAEVENPASQLSKWVTELETLFLTMNIKINRQKVLIHGVIVGGLISHFDPNSETVRRRDIYKNKLTVRSRKAIKLELLQHYLPFLKNKTAYY